MLSVRDLGVRYGKVQAVAGARLEVRRGELVTIVGPNGAGKTSLLRAIAGVVTPCAGSVHLDGAVVTGAPAETLVRRGLAMVAEGRELFGPLTVLDNLRLGAYALGRRNRGHCLAGDLERVLVLFPPLRARLGQAAGTLSGGEQQMVAIGRALMGRPRLLLLDEPSVGLAPLVVRDIFRVLEALKAEGLTMLLVEQNARAAFRIADRVHVLRPGGRLAEAAAAPGATEEAYGLGLVREEAAP